MGSTARVITTPRQPRLSFSGSRNLSGMGAPKRQPAAHLLE
jgi:hypothetical protein